jgi:hypothetical protein
MYITHFLIVLYHYYHRIKEMILRTRSLIADLFSIIGNAFVISLLIEFYPPLKMTLDNSLSLQYIRDNNIL